MRLSAISLSHALSRAVKILIGCDLSIHYVYICMHVWKRQPALVHTPYRAHTTRCACSIVQTHSPRHQQSKHSNNKEILSILLTPSGHCRHT